MLAAAIPGSTEGVKAWVGVYPIKLDSSDPRPEVQAAFTERRQGILEGLGLERPSPDTSLYRVVRFELPLKILAQEETLGNDYDLFVQNQEERYVYGDAALAACLQEWGLDISRLGPPWRADYPL